VIASHFTYKCEAIDLTNRYCVLLCVYYNILS